MDLSEFRSLLDFGMLVVLWLVQLVIYPGFLRCELTRFVEWHRTYTRRVSFVIIPIMFTQLPVTAWLAWRTPSGLNLAALACLLAAWVLTFGVSVPLHRRMDKGDTNSETMKRLIRTNWPRTLLWTSVFCLGLASG